MASLADQVEELEEDYQESRNTVRELEDRIEVMDNVISNLKSIVHDLEEQIDWIHTTYPDLEVAFEVKRRLDSAAV